MTRTTVEHLNPEGLHRSPAFTQAVAVTGPAKTVYVGGQNGVDASGVVVGDDLRSQSVRAFANLEAALAAAGAGLEHVVKWTILAVEGQPIHEGFEAFQQVWGQRPNPPAITVAIVSDLGPPGALVEIEAIAVVPLDGDA
jgi:enamine deaminase RidA (YjgF/YER057c/UK114 family)